jgi:hypothetical protein
LPPIESKNPPEEKQTRSLFLVLDCITCAHSLNCEQSFLTQSPSQANRTHLKRHADFPQIHTTKHAMCGMFPPASLRSSPTHLRLPSWNPTHTPSPSRDILFCAYLILLWPPNDDRSECMHCKTQVTSFCKSVAESVGYALRCI